jgi:F-BAR domain only protein
MNTISTNLATMAKALEEAQDKSEKLGKKGGKASTQKVDAASSKLDSATQQWESQAPFIFESLQALDESRVNQLRDLLTQFQTHEADCAQRIQDKSADTLAQVLEISSETEIHAFVNKATAGRARLPTRTSTRRSSVTGSSVAPPSTGASATLAPVVLQPPHDEPEPERSASPPPPPPPQEPQKPGKYGFQFSGSHLLTLPRIEIAQAGYHVRRSEAAKRSRRHWSFATKVWLCIWSSDRQR